MSNYPRRASKLLTVSILAVNVLLTRLQTDRQTHNHLFRKTLLSVEGISRVWPKDPLLVEKIESEISTSRWSHRIPRPRLPFGQPFYNFKGLAQRSTPGRENRVGNFEKPMVPLDPRTSITYGYSFTKFADRTFLRT
jgi:hypothetical protein